jgi:hypothetical protein
MAALERIIQLRSQGIPENEIIRTLQSEGISPREITDALSQSQIKQAVSNMDEETANMQPSMMGGKLSETQEEDSPPPTSEYVPPTAISENPPPPYPLQNSEEDYYPQSPYQQIPKNKPYQNQYSQPSYPQELSTGGEEYYPQEQEYEQYGEENYGGGYGYETSSNTDTIIEVAEQVFTEKMKKFQGQMDDLIEFKTLFETKVENISERLKRMEKMFDQMQISVIEKVGAYGRGIENLKKEIEMVEDSFSKISGKIKNPSSKKSKSKK